MVEAKSTKVRYSFLVRHGERADFAGDESQKSKPVDPRLTELGVRQA